MLKFVHRKHFNKLKGEYRVVVYYSFSEIILGLLLMVLATFFAVDYLKNNLKQKEVKTIGSVVIPEANKTYIRNK